MSELTFKIYSNRGEVSTHTFNKAVNDAVYLLNQFDAGISKRPRGTLNWFLTDLQSNGSFLMSFTPHLKPRLSNKSKIPLDIAPRVTEEFLDGVNDIETNCVTPPYLSENGLIRVGEMAELIEKDDVTKFSFTTEERTVEITQKTSDNVDKLLPIKRTAYGSIEGRLEGISVHKNFKGLLYHAITNKVVTCFFDESQIDVVKEALGKRVMVSGELQKNINGDTIRIKYPELEIMEGKKRFSLPTYEVKSANVITVPSFANVRSTAEYMRRIRGG